MLSGPQWKHTNIDIGWDPKGFISFKLHFFLPPKIHWKLEAELESPAGNGKVLVGHDEHFNELNDDNTKLFTLTSRSK